MAQAVSVVGGTPVPSVAALFFGSVNAFLAFARARVHGTGTCPSCGAGYLTGDRFCLSCGADHSADPTVDVLAQTEENTIGEYDIQGICVVLG
jgi:hypothetical protein